MVKQGLAFRIAGVYHQQTVFEEIERAFMNTVLSPDAFRPDDQAPMLSVTGAFLGDATYQEPALIARYDRLLPALDSAITALAR